MTGIISRIRNMDLRGRLLASYVLLTTVTLCIISIRYYSVSKEVISDIARKNAYEVVKKNNEIIDTKLAQIREKIISLITDKDLYGIFSGNKPTSDYDLLVMDNEVADYINKYFVSSHDVYSVQLAAGYHSFGPRTQMGTDFKNFIPHGEFTKSEIYHAAVEAQGRLRWIPTYDFAEMFHVKYMKDVNIDYRHMFSAVKLINGLGGGGAGQSASGGGTEDLVLIVNFKEDFFRKIFAGSIPFEGGYYFILSPDGQVISHQDEEKVAKYLSFKLCDNVKQKGCGTDSGEIDGRSMIVCYDTSKITGWISIIVIPPEQLSKQILPQIKSYSLYVTVILIIISALVSYILSYRISKPIKKLIQAIKKIGEGDFNVKIREEGSREFKELIVKFNDMNENIQRLITENYESKIKEKEAEITALNLQLDPHFMYNTLNIINLISIENGQDEISEMILSLSTMLKYTVKNRNEIVSFREDMNYLKSYIFIMAKRFEGRFDVIFDMEEELYPYGVPKFFMQPFVENALVHGFDSIKRGGILKITCYIKNNTRFFLIEDNGKGIEAERLPEIMDTEKGSIGISNILKRIKIIYGDGFGIQIESRPACGTKVTIRLPLK